MRNRLREYYERLPMQTLLEEYCRADDFSRGADDAFRDRMRRRKNTIHAIFHEREQERLRLRQQAESVQLIARLLFGRV